MIGILIGLVLAVLAVVVEVYLHVRKLGLTERLVRRVEIHSLPKGSILLPKDEGTVRQERIIAENDAAGRDTKLSELE